MARNHYRCTSYMRSVWFDYDFFIAQNPITNPTGYRNDKRPIRVFKVETTTTGPGIANGVSTHHYGFFKSPSDVYTNTIIRPLFPVHSDPGSFAFTRLNEGGLTDLIACQWLSARTGFQSSMAGFSGVARCGPGSPAIRMARGLVNNATGVNIVTTPGFASWETFSGGGQIDSIVRTNTNTPLNYFGDGGVADICFDHIPVVI